MPPQNYTKTQDTILCLNALTGITGKTQDLEVHGVRTLTRNTKKNQDRNPLPYFSN